MTYNANLFLKRRGYIQLILEFKKSFGKIVQSFLKILNS